MRRIFIAALVLAACATTDRPAAPDNPEGGIRREPCGGGPVFPSEEEPKTTDEQAAAPLSP